jgi:hypothetical protein
VTRDIDRAVAAANPVPQAVVDAHPLHGADGILADAILASPDVRSPGRPYSHRSRSRAGRGAIAVVAALALTAAGWATVRARTGYFGGGSGHEEGSGEFVRLDAPDAGPLVDRIGAGIELPPGATFDRWKERMLHDGADGSRSPGVTMTESGIVTSLSFDAACQWTAYWLDAYRAGDPTGMARSEPVLRAIPGWAAIAAGDPTGGVRVLLRRRASGAAAHDPAVFLTEFTTNCPSVASPPG